MEIKTENIFLVKVLVFYITPQNHDVISKKTIEFFVGQIVGSSLMFDATKPYSVECPQ